MQGSYSTLSSGDVRCSVRGDPRWVEVFHMNLRTVPVSDGEGRTIAELWRATCGMPATMAARVRMSNRESQRVARIKNDFQPNPAVRPGLPFAMCADVFIWNCTLNNRRASCDQVIYPWTSSMTLSH